MSGAVLFVSGPPHSGKTIVSHLLCRRFGYEYRNIGDLMLGRLQTPPTTRREIGPRFLEQFGVDGYVALLAQYAKAGVLFDGLRLREGLDSSPPGERVLLFKDGPHGATVEDGLEYDIAWLRAEAAVVFPWLPEPSAVKDLCASAHLRAALSEHES